MWRWNFYGAVIILSIGSVFHAQVSCSSTNTWRKASWGSFPLCVCMSVSFVPHNPLFKEPSEKPSETCATRPGHQRQWLTMDSNYQQGEANRDPPQWKQQLLTQHLSLNVDLTKPKKNKSKRDSGELLRDRWAESAMKIIHVTKYFADSFLYI